MEKERIIKVRAAKWLASHQMFLEDSVAKGIVNLVNNDFNQLPKVPSTHRLSSSGICQGCNKTGISYNNFEESFMTWGRNVLAQRPEADSQFDQAPVSLFQACHNIAYIIAHISNEETFAFLGDDDFHSLLLSKLLPNLKITVFEADERIISKVSELAKLHMLNIEVLKVNMIDNIPSEYHGKFDAFYSDPPYSKKGIFLFLYNGLLILKDKITSWGALAIPFTSLPLQVRELMVEVQQYLLNQEIFIEEMIPFFKTSPNKLGIISGIIKFQLIKEKQIAMPPMDGNLYEHFY